MNRDNKEREAKAVVALAQLEAVRVDAGEYPETFTVARPLTYQRCDDGGFALAYEEQSPGMFPSDFERRWDPQTKQWELKELGVDYPCR